MSAHAANICIDLPELSIGVCAELTFSISGRYMAATRHSPEEYPELDDVELESWDIDDDYRDDDSAEFDDDVVKAAIVNVIDNDFDRIEQDLHDATEEGSFIVIRRR